MINHVDVSDEDVSLTGWAVLRSQEPRSGKHGIKAVVLADPGAFGVQVGNVLPPFGISECKHLVALVVVCNRNVLGGMLGGLPLSGH